MVLYGVVLHNTVEDMALELSRVNSDFVFDFNVPLKGGNSNHFVLNWFGQDLEQNRSNLMSIRTTVSDSPRRYIDNTLKCIDVVTK